MGLSAQQKRAVANLLNAVDLMLRRYLPRLKEPFNLNIAELGLWRQELYLLADQLRAIREHARNCLLNPEEFLADLGPDDEPLDYAAVEYIPEEKRARKEERIRKAEEERIRKEKEDEILRQAGVLLDQEESGDDEAFPQERREGGLEEEGKSKTDFESDADDDDGEELFVPPFEERVASFRQGHRDLIQALEAGSKDLMQWVAEKPEVFQPEPKVNLNISYGVQENES